MTGNLKRLDGAENNPTSFGPVAPYYDELMKGIPYTMWVAYYQLLLAHQGLFPKKALDVCCGTGTICELLTEEGLQMTGFDLSAGMVQEARRKAHVKHLKIRYEVMDATSFALDDTFEAACSFFDSLNYVTDPANLQKVFERVYEHLEPGGSWIFDLNTAYAFEEDMFSQQSLGNKKALRYQWKGDWDPATRLIQVKMKFWYEGREFEELHVQRAYERDEITAMLERAGFEKIHVFHSYTLNPPRKKSDRLHYSCLKK